MNDPECQRLDDYLDGVMPDACMKSFERHLSVCDACQQAVLFERDLERAARESFEVVAVPPTIAIHAKSAIRSWQHRRQVAWISGVAAAVVVGALLTYQIDGWSTTPQLAEPNRLGDSTNVDDPTTKQTTTNRRTTPAERGPGDTPKTTVHILPKGSPRQVAVPIPTQSQSVTMVMLFPTITRETSKPAQEAPGDRDDTKIETHSTTIPRGSLE